MPMGKKPFLSAKGLLLCALLLLAAGIACAALSLSPRGTLALVEVDGQVVLERDLSSLAGTETVPLEGANGIQLTVELSPKGARVASSSCPDQVCVHTGLLTRAGESAICLPARATLRLEGGGDAIDATVY